MSLRINQNIDAFNSYRNLSVTQGQMSKSLEKLSSGFRINRAADDAAGLAISESLRSQVGGLKVAVRNAQDGVSVAQTAEGALTEVHAMLQRMRDLTVQAGNTGANGGAGGKAVGAIQEEIGALRTAIDDIANRTEFNGTKLLDGTNASLTFQVGANGGETQTVNLSDMNAAVLGGTTNKLTSVDVTSTTIDIAGDLDTIDAAIEQVSDFRGKLGAAQNTLRAHREQPQRGGREPLRLREPDPRHRHGAGDDAVHPLADPVPGRHLDAGAGQPGAPGRPVPAPLIELIGRSSDPPSRGPGWSTPPGPSRHFRRNPQVAAVGADGQGVVHGWTPATRLDIPGGNPHESPHQPEHRRLQLVPQPVGHPGPDVQVAREAVQRLPHQPRRRRRRRPRDLREPALPGRWPQGRRPQRPGRRLGRPDRGRRPHRGPRHAAADA